MFEIYYSEFDRVTFICVCNSKIVYVMKRVWQAAERQVFRQLNFSNIWREMTIEALLQRFEYNYPVNLR